MRSRKSAHDELAEVARRRLELLGEELAAIRGAQPAGLGAREAESEAGGGGAAAGGGGEGQVGGPTVLRPGRHARRPLGRATRWGGWLHDRLPATMQGRVQLGSGHLAVVALLVAVGLALTAWWVVRAEGSSTVLPTATWTDAQEPAALVTPSVDTAEPPYDGPTGAAQGVSAGDAVAEVVVDVAGKVRRPGIVVLPTGSRVVDALEEAGGPRRGVDLTTLNLARLLVDGEQIVVGVPAPPGVAAPAASAPGVGASGTLMVNLNSATQAELEELPGIGPVTATAILAWRTDHGSFTAVDELLEVSGIGEATLAEVAPHVTL